MFQMMLWLNILLGKIMMMKVAELRGKMIL